MARTISSSSSTIRIRSWRLVLGNRMASDNISTAPGRASIHRKSHDQDRAAIVRISCSDGATVLINYSLHDRKTESRPSTASGEEGLKHARTVGGTETGTVVAHDTLDHSFARVARGHRDVLQGPGVLDRVRDQVLERVREAVRVHQHRQSMLD